MRLSHLIVVAALWLVPSFAHAQPAWDSRGWVMLGEREVHGHGRMERDVMPVGRQEGRFNKLTIVVENSDLEMIDFAVKFEHGDPWHPGLSHFFREGQRTRVIEFPESAWGTTQRAIQAIEFTYRNVPGEGHARVQVWGWRTGDAAAPPPPPAPSWDSRGWVQLGERAVRGHGRMERDVIPVGRQDGRFNKLTIVVEDSDLELVDFAVKFEHGPAWHPGVSHFFREGQRTRVIEFPESAWGNTQRAIQAIEFAYRNVPGEGHARVQVWGWRTGDGGERPAPMWNSDGWVPLGDREVHGHGQMERDRIAVGRGEGKFSRLTIVVENSDLEMIDFIVNFAHGDPFHPEVKHYFREGQRTRVIELPPSDSGRTARTIQSIDFMYRNVPGEGHARVQVWAQ